MDKHEVLPFKVGQLAEARSFLSGYRSAWFRCKIKEITRIRGRIVHALEYFDFPDEKVKLTRLYQVPPLYGKKSKGIKRWLMVRPCYPPVYHKSQMPHVREISEVAVIVDGVWKVGDLVDWWTDGCYWSGTITQILANGRIQIELPHPPLGEGASYEVSCNDLRPSLDWSPDIGWTVPSSMDGENIRCCARLIQPKNPAAGAFPEIHAMEEGRKYSEDTAGSSFNVSISSHRSDNSLPAPDKSKRSRTGELLEQPLSTVPKETMLITETNMEAGMGDNGAGKTSCSDSVSSSHGRDASAEVTGQNVGEDLHCPSGSKKSRDTEGVLSNSMCSDTLEAAILDLEELANKVKWLKGILQFGVPLSTTARPSWKFVEQRPSSVPK
ncbi:unnamed protein product [Ilex paraguariensis]|uniref:Agenet domain-containing protein n=1 Tax=Ilex paraguariensis TaxID=185542 RepID=A0ABC8TBW7_9AQUA